MAAGINTRKHPHNNEGILDIDSTASAQKTDHEPSYDITVDTTDTNLDTAQHSQIVEYVICVWLPSYYFSIGT
jgi:hypothetical protein